MVIVRAKFTRATLETFRKYLGYFDQQNGATTVIHIPEQLKEVSLDHTDIRLIEIIDRACVLADLYWRYTTTGVEIGALEVFANNNAATPRLNPLLLRTACAVTMNALTPPAQHSSCLLAGRRVLNR